MKKTITLLVILYCTILWGCKSLDTLEKVPEKETIQEYIEKGQYFEEKEDLLNALEQYKIAHTIDPKNTEINTKISSIEEEIQQLVEVHYNSGINHHRRGEYKAAQIEFLKVLRYQRYHKGALEMVIPEKLDETQRFIIHTVRPNESLSKIAILYYGDFKKYHFIAQYNNIDDASKVLVGDKIKVPEIEGITFLKPDKYADQKITREAKATPKKDIKKEPPADLPRQPDEMPLQDKGIDKEENSMTDTMKHRNLGVELFNKNQYQEAIVELTKALNQIPNDEKTLHYLYLSYFQQAMVLYEKGDYLKAKNEFQHAHNYNKNCGQCLTYIKQSEQVYKEIHYNKGIAYFSNEQLAEAIYEWELVEAIDPDYKKVQENIKKAKRLFQKLEEIQKGN